VLWQHEKKFVVTVKKKNLHEAVFGTTSKTFQVVQFV
jgi:hypothetical protein